jgi:hypothetical protein
MGAAVNTAAPIYERDLMACLAGWPDTRETDG